MDSEETGQIVNRIYNIFTHTNEPENPTRWFISFGAMLYFLRGDKRMGKPFDGDFDISLLDRIPEPTLINNMESFGFTLEKKIINDITGEPFQMVFKGVDHLVKDIRLDVFFWIRVGSYYWHTYDYHMEFKNRPREYVFKGTPATAFDGEFWEYTWEDIAPPLKFPCLYGTLLDIWYPGWFLPDPKFGQSKAAKIVKLKTCKNLEANLI